LKFQLEKDPKLVTVLSLIFKRPIDATVLKYPAANFLEVSILKYFLSS
jgi:hypothetical protein